MSSILFKECIEVLNVDLLPESESKKISDLFNKMVPMNSWGKVDWEKINKKKHIGYAPQEIVETLRKFLDVPLDKKVYIEWSSASFPVIATDLDSIIDCFDDVSCVSMEKFIFNPFQRYIIEIRPGDDITVGIINS